MLIVRLKPLRLALRKERAVGSPLPPRPPISGRQGDWFTSRISACALVAVAYEALPGPTRAEIRALFAQASPTAQPAGPG